MLYLNAGVHLHEKVLVAIDNALKGGNGIQTHRRAKTRRFVLHFLQRNEVLTQHGSLCAAPCSLGLGQRRLQRLNRYRHLEQFLLVHLQRTVPAAQCDTPVAIADNLDFLMAGRLDVQLDQNVLVVAYAGCFHFVEDFANQLRCALCLANAEDALALASTTADRLQAYPIFRVILGHLLHRLGQGFTQLVYCVEVHSFYIGSRQHEVGLVFQGDIRIIQLIQIRRQIIGGAERLQRGNVWMLLEQRQRGAVVDAGRHRNASFQGGALGFILEAGIVHGAGAGTNKIQPGLFHRSYHGLVFRHESVAGKYRVVAVVVGNADDLCDTLVALFLVRPGVIGHPVYTIRVGQ